MVNNLYEGRFLPPEKKVSPLYSWKKRSEIRLQLNDIASKRFEDKRKQIRQKIFHHISAHQPISLLTPLHQAHTRSEPSVLGFHGNRKKQVCEDKHRSHDQLIDPSPTLMFEE